ncbi:MAG: HAD-IB family hydrolase, partial [bacterium]|nr:HAD-IB family hydrolase [bacterium]
ILDKAKILQRAVEKNGLTLKGSIGVGDTASDIAFLSLVDKPICFNPNKKLYDHAKKKKWIIAVERKDVIYYH